MTTKKNERKFSPTSDRRIIACDDGYVTFSYRYGSSPSSRAARLR